KLKQLLTTTRLLTLTGSGGTGKTRLSLQVAAEVLDTYADGVWLVELAPLTDPALVPQTVASVLHVRAEAGRSITATLSDYLCDKQLLLILDNCEHLIEACAQFADAVLHASRETRILASSREALGIAGELAYRVPSLQLPISNAQLPIEELTRYESVRLFVERATFALPTFTVTHANAPAVAQICQRLDGIPLAIELAAARMKALSVEQVAARLDDRFRLLTGGSRTALPRQQTLRATMDWSYALVSEAERVLLRRLSVFAGGWTLEAAESVCSGQPLATSDILDLLVRLVDKSLVVPDAQSEGASRYRMLETIRQYAREKLSESDEGDRVRDRQLDYFMRLAEEAEPKIRSAEQMSWLHRLEAELENVRVALDWSGGGANIEKRLRLVAALDAFWGVRGHQTEGIEILRNLLARPEATARTLLRARALNTLSNLYWRIGNDHQGKIAADGALAIGRELHDTRTIADALLYLSNAKIWQRSDGEAQALLDQSLAMY
ncbi:MAG: adenylate/guanylate cyclase domain-containing protein, partial [Chloroflexi bacterium]|nr:adenylate/guanylate cyclase domain-containing protein [Chloroflexota bacterium]